MVDQDKFEIPPYPDKINDTIYDVFRSYVDPVKGQFQLTNASIQQVWRSLNNDERDRLRKTLERNRSQDVRKYVKYLSSLEPYLKMDQRRRSSLRRQQAEEKTNTIEEGIEQLERLELDASSHNDDGTLDQHDFREGIENCDPPIPDKSLEALPQLYSCSDPQPVSCPVPPPIDSRDLYLRTQGAQMSRKQCLAEWNQLSPLCKKRYRDATNILKKQYLREYENYLHSLESKDLYALYKQRVRF